MRATDPLKASRSRRAGPGTEFALGEVVAAMEYDIVGEQGGRWAQVRSGITTIEEVRAELESFAWVNPAITWHVIVRTTTTVETLADHLLTSPPTESEHQLRLDFTPRRAP